MAATVTAAKKTAPKRPARPKPPPPVAPRVDDGPRVLRFVSAAEEPEEREPLFYIDDREYTIPKVMRTNDALDCLHVFRTQGELFATDYLLEKLLGEEAYTALRSYKGLTSDDLKQIVEVATERMMGAAEAPKA